MSELRFILSMALIMAASILVFGNAWASPESEHHHHHHHDGAADLILSDGERWATDESLRTGMSGIYEAFDQAHGVYQAGGLDGLAAAALADRVDEQVNFIFANCSLPADADAELHKLLAAALGAATTLRAAPDPHDGLHQLHVVLDTYGEHFEHPDWPTEVCH